MIDRATIERIMETTDIVDVVSDFVALKRRGANHVACCPFHNEKTPSFHVSSSKGIYKCFGCGKSGNAITFLMEHEQMSYVEAIKYLGAKYGIEVVEKEESAEEVAQRQKRESLLIVNEFAQKTFHNNLLNTDEGKIVGLEYFYERKITDQAIEFWGLGYSLKDRESFSALARSKGYDKNFLIETGLSIAQRSKENPDELTGKLIDRFAERVIFPIRDISGRVVAFGGRKLRNDNPNIAKYVNSPESELYIKNKTLYGLFEAKKSIEKEDNCYLVEGYTDVISLYIKGVTNVVASCGTSLTQGQILLIKRFTNNITVLYDGDSAGIHASLRGIDMFLAEGFNVSVVLFPDGEDPDSYARGHNEQELKEFLASNREDFISFKCRINNLDEINRDPIKKARFVGDITQSIAVIPDPVLRSIYVDQTSKNLEISASVLSEQINEKRAQINRDNSKRTSNYHSRTEKNYSQNTSSVESQKVVPLAEETPLLKYEKAIIYYLVKFGNNKITLDTTPTKEPESVLVASFIKEVLEADSTKLLNATLQQIYDEYFQLNEEQRKDENAIKYFQTKYDMENKISKMAIEIFDEKYSFRSKKIKDSILDESLSLNKNVQLALLTYKLKLVEKMISEQNQLLQEAAKSKDSQKEIEVLSFIKLLIGVKNNLTQTIETL